MLIGLGVIFLGVGMVLAALLLLVSPESFLSPIGMEDIGFFALALVSFGTAGLAEGKARPRSIALALVLAGMVTAVAPGYLEPNVACFGNCGHSQLLVPGTGTCSESGALLVCTLAVANYGTENVNAVGCSVQLGSASSEGVVGGMTAFAAGGSAAFTCSFSGTRSPSGTSTTGLIILANGDDAAFFAVWS